MYCLLPPPYIAFFLPLTHSSQGASKKKKRRSLEQSNNQIDACKLRRSHWCRPSKSPSSLFFCGCIINFGMEKGGASAMDMDAAASSQDMWDWEVLPDHMSSSSMDSKLASSPHGGHGRSLLEDQEAEEPNLPASEDAAADECKDIVGVVAAAEEDKPSQEEPMPTEAEPLASDAEGEEEETFESSDAKEVDDVDGEAAAEEGPLVFAGGEGEDEAGKRKGSRAGRPEYCAVFGVGKLRVNGIGALCSFGVAAAAVCILLAGGRPPQQEKKKIQLQFYADDKRMHQVVQQTSRLNQAMSSLMGGSGSPRANISFGGYYDGF